jgi:SNF2 family DNA or RNA helicase
VEIHDGKCLISAEAGMGKTLPACCIAFYYASSCSDILVIAPTNTIGGANGWIAQFKKWVNLDAVFVQGSKGKMVPGKVTIMTYSSAKSNLAVLSHPWVVTIFDESQALKNPEAQCTKALIPVARRSRCTLMISATPRFKCNSELYKQIEPLLEKPEEILGTYVEYIQRYCSAIWMKLPYKPAGWELGKNRHLSEMNAITRKVMIRKDRKELELEQDEAEKIRTRLPEKKRMIEYVQLTDKAVLEQIEALRDEYDSATSKDQQRQVTGKQWRLTGAAKVEAIMTWSKAWLNEHAGEKLVLFAHSVSVLNRYHELFTEFGATSVVVDGTVQPKKRCEAIDCLSSPTDMTYRVGLLSYGTCSLGVTLCPGISVGVLAELEYTPTTMEQAEGKIHRVGAVRPVFIYWFVAMKTIDSMVMNMIQSKTNSNSQVLDGKERHLAFSLQGQKKRKIT